MITEDYVSFETAKLLKENGFDVYVRSFYDADDMPAQHNEALWDWNLNKENYRFSAPTLQMAMKWLREVHRIIIVIQPLSFNGAKDFLCDNWVYSMWLGVNLKIGESLKNQNTSSTYEEACEAAIKYCLENLIYKKR